MFQKHSVCKSKSLGGDAKGQTQNHRITAELKGTQKEHLIQLLVLHRTPQEFPHVPESIV